MNDLFVEASARGGGVAEALIRECVERCRVRGARSLTWQTAKENRRAQGVYERVGAIREEWLDYSIEIPESRHRPT
jgi:ribosomal protein S18 acetylase RimI-like enzyme